MRGQKMAQAGLTASGKRVPLSPPSPLPRPPRVRARLCYYSLVLRTSTCEIVTVAQGACYCCGSAVSLADCGIVCVLYAVYTGSILWPNMRL